MNAVAIIVSFALPGRCSGLRSAHHLAPSSTTSASTASASWASGCAAQ